MTTHTGLDETSGDDRVHGKQITDLVLSYLVCPTDAAGAFVGAILLTDNRARPQHFAYVQPVKPTSLQRILYGSTLVEYIKVDVIAQKLWQGLPKKPDVLFVDTPDLIAARRIAQVPTAHIAKIPDAETNSSSLSTLRYDVGPHLDDQGMVGETVVALEGICSLLEPFTRIHQALKEGLKAGV